MKHATSTWLLYLFTCVILFFSCGTTAIDFHPRENLMGENEAKYSYLALGDSYTIGESVGAGKSFPEQLTNQLNTTLQEKTAGKIIATTGWRTDNLLSAINSQNLKHNYNVATLLIGVNNQYQNRPFSQYESEFTSLLEKTIELVAGEKDHVLVISIPDYAYTPFSANSDRKAISAEIDRYNTYAKEAASDAGVRFFNITDITRKGLEEPELVADDGLHPSGEAYRRFVERILPFVISQLKKQ